MLSCIKDIQYSSTVTSLTRGSPHVVTRRYLLVKFKNFSWKSLFHEMWSFLGHAVARYVEFHET